MGLNWAAALSNVADGMGRIAQVKYAEFMRQDENSRREREREMDFKRQKNLERFRLKGQQDMQAAGFTHTEGIENARIEAQKLRDQADSEYRMKSLSNQERQISASASSAATQANESAARLKLLEDQAGYAKADRELQQQLSVWRIPLEAAQAEMNAVMAQRLEKIKQAPEGMPPDTSYEDGLIATAKQKIDAAVDGQIGFMVANDHIKMAPDVKERYESVLSTPKADGTYPSKVEAMQRANNPVVVPEPGTEQFVPSGGNRGLPSPSGAQSGGSTAGFAGEVAGGNMLSPSAIPRAGKALAGALSGGMDGAAAAFDDAGMTPSLSPQVPTSGPSKTDLEFAMRKLDPRTIEKLKTGGALSSFEQQQLGELNVRQEDFRRMFGASY